MPDDGNIRFADGSTAICCDCFHTEYYIALGDGTQILFAYFLKKITGKISFYPDLLIRYDKIVQLPFNIPLVEPNNMDAFIETLLPETLQQCRKLLIEGLSGNPRQIKRFINALKLNHALAISFNIPDYNSEILSVLLLLQLLSHELYNEIAIQPDLLVRLKREDQDSKDIYDKYLKDNLRLQRIFKQVHIPKNIEIKNYIYLTNIAQISSEPVAQRRPYFIIIFEIQDISILSEIYGHEAAQDIVGTFIQHIADFFRPHGAVTGRETINEVSVTSREGYSAVYAEELLVDFRKYFQDRGIPDFKRILNIKEAKEAEPITILAGIGQGQPRIEVESVKEFARFKSKRFLDIFVKDLI
ncbi:hypothetical protein N9174_02935 [bacterium]|nr:hypothetical protein [bacterium]